MTSANRHKTSILHMNCNKHLRRFLAWMFIVTFMWVFAIKDFHVHEDHPSKVHFACDGTTKVFQSSCFICDFILHKASAPTLQTYQPAVFATILTPYVFTQQTVYRHVEAVNTHSPPVRG